MKSPCVKILILLYFIVVYAAVPLSAQDSELHYGDNHSIDVKIYFPYDQSHIDPDYMGNHRVLEIVDSLLSDLEYISTLERIEITAQSSPEGKVEYNTRLSERRRLAVKEFFLENYPEIDPNLWSFVAMAENWELFREHLLEDPNLPQKERVMAVVDGDRDPDAKEWLLKIMDGGRPWRYIKEHILPTQRFGASVLFIPKKELYALPEPVDDVFVSYPVEIDSPISFPSIEVPLCEREPEAKVLFAVKSNLVLDALTVVNLAVEVPIGKRFSVVGELVYPWWRSWPSDYTMQIESYHGELKYWLGDRDSKEHLQGLYVGVYGGWGRYDIQPFSRTGVQGTFTDVGVEVGYAHQIARNLHLEYTLGLGYISTCYDDYYMANDTEEYGDIKVIPYPWMKNSLKSVLPTRLGVSLVWTIKSRGGSR